jgi:hypothetical protein
VKILLTAVRSKVAVSALFTWASIYAASSSCRETTSSNVASSKYSNVICVTDMVKAIGKVGSMKWRRNCFKSKITLRPNNDKETTSKNAKTLGGDDDDDRQQITRLDQ